MRNRIAILISLSLCAGCVNANPLNPAGDIDDPDTIFLYVLNAVGGADAITVDGPGRRLAKDLGFAERMAEDGTCPEDEICVPLAVHRRHGSTFMVRYDGGKAELDLAEELGAFYPHETGTLILSAGGPDGVRPIVVRHSQTVSDGCGLSVVNALSVGELAGGAPYEIATEVKLTPEEAGYRNERDTAHLTRCGELPTTGEQQVALARTELETRMSKDGWFFRTVCETGDCLRWAARDEDETPALPAGGEIEAVPTTDEYFECLRDAIRVNTPDDSCPETLTWDDVSIDWLEVDACARPQTLPVQLAPPGEVATSFGDAICESDVRVRTPGADQVFGPDASDTSGVHQDGTFVRSTLAIPQGAEWFLVWMGRPVNPVVWQWSSSDTFVDLEAFQ